MKKVKLTNGGIPGVFNCRFTNPTATNLNRKKKKPTTFVPPPIPQTMTSIGETKQWSNSNGNTRQLIPFWKRPLSVSMQVRSRLPQINFNYEIRTLMPLVRVVNLMWNVCPCIQLQSYPSALCITLVMSVANF